MSFPIIGAPSAPEGRPPQPAARPTPDRNRPRHPVTGPRRPRSDRGSPRGTRRSGRRHRPGSGTPPIRTPSSRASWRTGSRARPVTASPFARLLKDYLRVDAPAARNVCAARRPVRGAATHRSVQSLRSEGPLPAKKSSLRTRAKRRESTTVRFKADVREVQDHPPPRWALGDLLWNPRHKQRQG